MSFEIEAMWKQLGFGLRRTSLKHWRLTIDPRRRSCEGIAFVSWLWRAGLGWERHAAVDFHAFQMQSQLTATSHLPKMSNATPPEKQEEEWHVKEEYLTLRKEVETCMAELATIERACVGGVAVVFAWVAKDAPADHTLAAIAWLTPMMIPIYGALKSLALFTHIRILGSYLERIETLHFSEQGGWQVYFGEPGRIAKLKTIIEKETSQPTGWSLKGKAQVELNAILNSKKAGDDRPKSMRTKASYAVWGAFLVATATVSVIGCRNSLAEATPKSATPVILQVMPSK